MDEIKRNSITKFQKAVVLLIFSLVDLLAATVVSLQAPFYPEVASKKGASATQYGLVFGIFELTAIVSSIIFGFQISKLGPRRVFICGIFATGFFTIIFGRLNVIETSSYFIVSSVFVRIGEAIGETAYITASFTLIAVYFPESAATCFAILEACYGVGLIVGPTCGGLLYELGGFTTPFTVMGSLLCISSLVAMIVLDCIQQPKESFRNLKPTAMLDLIRIPQVAVASYGIVASATGMGFISALLEPHLRQFSLSKSNVGFVFVFCGGVYSISAIAWGWICDNLEHPQAVSCVGMIFGAIGYILIGPLYFVPLDTILWVTCVGLGLFGLGLSAVYVSSFAIILSTAINSGFPDNISTYGIVSGLWTCMVCVGYFIGPTLGGVLEDLPNVGFRKGSLLVLVALSVHVLILILRLCWRRKSHEKFSIQQTP